MKEIKITHPSDAGQRLDKFVKKYLPNAPLGGIYKMLRTGKIKVNGKKKDQTYKIELEDTINFWLSDEEIENMRHEVGGMSSENPPDRGDARGVVSKHSEQNPSVLHGGSRTSPLLRGVPNVLYEDEYLLVVNKRAGMNVHPGDHKTKEVSLIELVQDYLGGKHDSLTFRPALVHRIDRDTSGCMLIAKEKETLEALLEALQSHKIEKIYHAITLGVPEKPSGTIRAKILRLENAKDEAKVRVDEAGQNAVTHYRVIGSMKYEVGSKGNLPLLGGAGGGTPPNLSFALPRFAQVAYQGRNKTDSSYFSLLECRIETGRTHQIRVHLSFINCPILGDKAYGNISINSFIRRNFGITRQLLHAFRLSFIHPKTKKMLHVEAPYPEDFAKLINKR